VCTYAFLLLLLRLMNGAAVRLTGRLVSSPGKEQSCELLVDQNDVGEVVVLGECDPEASLQKGAHLHHLTSVQK
jgi:aspartyl/asparaginyl-tRNA synthetase